MKTITIRKKTFKMFYIILKKEEYNTMLQIRR